ncbi:MAG: hypothetical protein WBL39_22295 [Terrimicrobiaceae bacterium]
MAPTSITPEAARRPKLDLQGGRFYLSGMSEIQDAEDRLIRRILIAIPTVVLLGFLATVALITVMISYNFNILDWLE